MGRRQHHPLPGTRPLGHEAAARCCRGLHHDQPPVLRPPRLRPARPVRAGGHSGRLCRRDPRAAGRSSPGPRRRRDAVAQPRRLLRRQGQRREVRRTHPRQLAAVRDSLPGQHHEHRPCKSLLGIPWRVAIALTDAGWILRNDIVWAKPNPTPESVRDRCVASHEHLFLLTKTAPYWFDQDALAEPGQGRASGSRPDTARAYAAATGGHDLPPRWDRAPVDWDPDWGWPPAVHVCPPRHFRPEPCPRRGSTASRPQRCGRVWSATRGQPPSSPTSSTAPSPAGPGCRGRTTPPCRASASAGSGPGSPTTSPPTHGEGSA